MDKEKLAVIKSQAGMRFIAQQTIYNSGDFKRLKDFINDSYSETALSVNPTDRRLLDLKTAFKLNGRLKIKQVVGTNEHQVVLVLEAEKSDGFFYTEMQVDEEYPHKITHFLFQKMQEVSEE